MSEASTHRLHAELASLGPIDRQRRGTTLVLTINNPRRRNALNAAAEAALAAAVREAMADEQCRAIVLTGAGGVFSAGGDISDMSEGAVEAQRRLQRAGEIVMLLSRGPKPVVAAVQGYATGAGLSIAVACDQVVAGCGAKLGAAFVRVGLIADVGLLWTLPRRVGTGFAKRMLLFGELVDAQEGHQHGLVDVVVEDEKVMETALELAERLAGLPPLAIEYSKAILARSELELEALLMVEAQTQAVLFGTEDFTEGRKAFFERRAGVFHGR